MATDFRSGHDFPRRGREEYREWYWLLRVFDKARAKRNGTIHDYIYPCPMDRAVFESWGITADAFDAALETCETDGQIFAWVSERVSPEQRDAAKHYLLTERIENLDRQDAEEGAVPV
jgi:hypothetical protein